MVHQLDHFVDELAALTDSYLHPSTTTVTTHLAHSPHTFGSDLLGRYKPRNTNALYVDRAWQAVAASQCLFDCVDSVMFDH